MPHDERRDLIRDTPTARLLKNSSPDDPMLLFAAEKPARSGDEPTTKAPRRLPEWATRLGNYLSEKFR